MLGGWGGARLGQVRAGLWGWLTDQDPGHGSKGRWRGLSACDLFLLERVLTGLLTGILGPCFLRIRVCVCCLFILTEAMFVESEA